jgi:lipoxygenase homology domain-containing protein 1
LNSHLACLGRNGDSGELELKDSSTHRNKFERDHEDVFTFNDILSLGELTRVRIRHDDSALMKSSWHLEYVQVTDNNANRSYMFPCNKWLSSSKDDKQIIRELTCNDDSSNDHRNSQMDMHERISYEIEIVTSDKQDAGTTQHGWIILCGKKKRSERFYMKNTSHKKILRG